MSESFHTLCLEINGLIFVASQRIDAITTQQHPALDVDFVHQVINGGHSLQVRCSTSVKKIFDDYA